MSQIRSHGQLLSMMKNRNDEEAKSIINNENLYNAVIDDEGNTLLHHAAEYGNSEIVKFLIDSGSKVNARNKFGEYPLRRSFESNLPCKKVTELLLRASAGIYVRDSVYLKVLNTVNSIDWLTADTRRFEILKVFVEHISDMIDLEVLYNGNEEVIKTLLETNVNLSKADSEGQTLVHMLAKNPNPRVIELLRDRTFNVNVRDNYERTPLMFAVKAGVARVVKFLLSQGADVEAKNSNHVPVLYNAIKEYFERYSDDRKEIVQVLLEHGANVQVETNDENNPTIFDLLTRHGDENRRHSVMLASLPIANLALQNRRGVAFTDLIYKKISDHNFLEWYFFFCQWQLDAKILPTITLFDLLTASERKMERYLRNEELASKLMDFRTQNNYYNVILRKRVAKARRMVELRRAAAPIVCKLMKMNYDHFPFIVDEIVSYFDECDIQRFLLVERELYCDYEDCDICDK